MYNRYDNEILLGKSACEMVAKVIGSCNLVAMIASKPLCDDKNWHIRRWEFLNARGLIEKNDLGKWCVCTYKHHNDFRAGSGGIHFPYLRFIKPMFGGKKCLTNVDIHFGRVYDTAIEISKKHKSEEVYVMVESWHFLKLCEALSKIGLAEFSSEETPNGGAIYNMSFLGIKHTVNDF